MYEVVGHCRLLHNVEPLLYIKGLTAVFFAAFPHIQGRNP